MKNYLRYELSPFPLSLFTENGFRKNTKSHLYEKFTAIPTSTVSCIQNKIHVIDGGFLLHKVVWRKNDTLQSITDKYVNFVCNNYSNGSYIIFDGYPESQDNNDSECATSTKAAERLKRKSNSCVPEFDIAPDTIITLTQDKFLSNEKNKDHLIKKLLEVFSSKGFIVKQAEEDADALIINTSIEIAEENKSINSTTGEVEYMKTVIVVGQDIDLLVLLNQLSPVNSNIYFIKPGTANVNDSLYNAHSFEHEQYRSVIALLHCFTGCDTNSGFAGKGKLSSVSSLISIPELIDLVQPFYINSTDRQIIAEIGCKLIKSMYKCKDQAISLDDFRYKQYQIMTAKKSFKLENLAPTVGAATQHAYRAYFQLQAWLGNKKIAAEWGWKQVTINDTAILMPCTTEARLIPEDLLKIISCKCKTSCESNRCGCRKHGLRCTNLCVNCNDLCANIEIISQDSPDGEEEEDQLTGNCEATCIDAEKESAEESFSEQSFQADQEETDYNTSNDECTATEAKKLRLI